MFKILLLRNWGIFLGGFWGEIVVYDSENPFWILLNRRKNAKKGVFFWIFWSLFRTFWLLFWTFSRFLVTFWYFFSRLNNSGIGFCHRVHREHRERIATNTLRHEEFLNDGYYFAKRYEVQVLRIIFGWGILRIPAVRLK